MEDIAKMNFRNPKFNIGNVLFGLASSLDVSIYERFEFHAGEFNTH